MVRTFPEQAVASARADARINCGVIMATMMATITTAIINSIKLNPSCPAFMVGFLRIVHIGIESPQVLQSLTQLRNGRIHRTKHAIHDTSDDEPHDARHEWLEVATHGVKLIDDLATQ